MSKNIQHLQHIKSNVVIEEKPKLPTAEALVEGELAVNYAEGYETISLKNSSSGITTFSSDDYYTKKKLGSGFTGANSANTVTSVIDDLDSRKIETTAFTPSDYYTKSETSGSTELSTAFGTKINSSTYTGHTATTISNEVSSQMHLPTVTAEDNGKVLMVVNGAWALVNLSTIYTGNGTPTSDTGTDGDVYLQIT